MAIDKSKVFTLFALTLLIGSLLLVSMNVPTTVAQETTLYLDPTPVTAHVCENFTVALNIRGVTDLYAWEVKLSFDPSLLECLGATEGPFLQSSGPTIWPSPTIDNIAGTVHMGCSLMIPPGVSGSGTLAYIKFYCDGPGQCDLIFLYPPTWLMDSFSNSIPHTAVNGHVIQVQPLPSTMDLELHPPRVEDLGDPTCTQWHELHPSKTNYYHLTSWTPGNVLSPEDLVYMQESPMEPWIGPFEVDDVTIDLTVRDEYTGIVYWMDYECGYWTFDPKKPICTKWNEIKSIEGPPPTPRCWHLTNWEDTGDGKLSDCDWIEMKLMYPNQPYIGWFHVELVTVTLKLTLDFTPVYLEFMGTLEEFQAMDYIYRPVCTMWHEILPVQGRQWHLVHWWDRPFLSPSDQILLTLGLTEEQLYIFWSMGDVNEDCYINETDLELIGAHYCTGDPQYDIDEDGHVGIMDFMICAENIGLDIWTYFGVERAWYHVDKLTVAMNLTDGVEEHIVKFEGSLLQFKKYHWRYPMGTQWHEVNPEYCRQWYLSQWFDDGDGYLDYGDLIIIIDKVTGEESNPFLVNSISTDMWLTMAVCDVEVTSVVPETNYAYPRWTNDVDVTVHNNGTVTFNCTVTLSYYNGSTWIAIATQSVTYLDPCNTVTLKFAWSLAGVPYCNRTLKAEATCTCGDTDEGYSWVKVKMPGDVDADGDCDADDVFTYVSPSYGKKLGQPGFNKQTDFDDDNDCDADDVFTYLSPNYGKKYTCK